MNNKRLNAILKTNNSDESCNFFSNKQAHSCYIVPLANDSINTNELCVLLELEDVPFIFACFRVVTTNNFVFFAEKPQLLHVITTSVVKNHHTRHSSGFIGCRSHKFEISLNFVACFSFLEDWGFSTVRQKALHRRYGVEN